MTKIRLVKSNRLGARGVAQTLEDAQRQERQAAWVKKRNARLEADRARRRELLAHDSASRGDRMAGTAWGWLTGAGAVTATPANIGILDSYVAYDAAGVTAGVDELEAGSLPSAPPPPVLRIAAGGGRSLPLHLSMLAVAQLIITDGARMTNSPKRDRPGESGRAARATAAGGLRVVTLARDEADWAKVLGIAGQGKARTVRVHEPLRRLHQLGFVDYPPGHPSKFTLLSEDGTGRPWGRPERDPLDPSFSVPFNFWRNRWYLWLTPAEIATLLAISHAWENAPASAGSVGLGLPESVRRSVYGMSGERYGVIHELIEFGLLELVSPSLRPKRSKASKGTDAPRGHELPGLTHHVRPRWSGLDSEARGTILQRLKDNSLPPRLHELPEQRVAYAAQLRSAADGDSKPAQAAEASTTPG